MTRLVFLVGSFFILGAMLVACKLPAPGAATPDTAAAYTQAAQTIIAELTRVAPSATALVTPPVPPGETPGGESPAEASPTAGATEPVATPTNADSPTPESTAAEPTPSPTQSPAATSTPTTPSTDPKAGLGNPKFRDIFENDDNWSLYDNKRVSFEIDDDRLRMIALQADSSDWFMLSWPQLEDFYLEMTATPKDCSGRDRYGLVFRSVKSDDAGYEGYMFGLTCDGQYSLRIWNGSKHIVLVNWTASQAIHKGPNQANRLGVLVKGKKISLYANGNLLTEISDDQYAEGRFGPFVGSVNTEDFTVNVSEIAYWDLP
jgi:hypothetical protein